MKSGGIINKKPNQRGSGEKKKLGYTGVEWQLNLMNIEVNTGIPVVKTGYCRLNPRVCTVSFLIRPL
jgi:hypothetical protein